MTAQTFIFRENAGRCELHSHAADHKRAEMEVSRLNFRGDGWGYTAITGIFADDLEARRYAQLRSKGMNPEQAMKRLRAELGAAANPAASPPPERRARWRNPRAPVRAAEPKR